MSFKEDLNVIRNKNFMKVFLSIAIPIVIQNMFSQGLNFVDSIMIGGIGNASAIAAVSVANKIYFLYSLVAFGMISGASIFFAQYHGNRDYHRLKRTMGMTFILVSSVSIVFTIIAILFPHNIMGFFSADKGVIDQGVDYLRIILITYFFTGISFTISFALRAINKTMLPMVASIMAVIINVFFNYMLIYGKLGAPKLEVKGAAIATLIARLFEFFIMIYFLQSKNSILKSTFKELLSFRFIHIKHFMRITVPVLLNESFWALGMIAYTFAYSKLGTFALASTDIGSNVSELFFVLSFGICHGGAIMVGNALGANEKEKAHSYGNVFIYFATLVGTLTGILLLVFTKPILGLYVVDADTMNAAYKILVINAFLMPIRFLNILFLVGIFRGGGDTRYALFIELISLWGIGIPLTFILVYLFKAPIHIVYGAHFLEEFIKTLFSLPRYRKGLWLKKVISHD